MKIISYNVNGIRAAMRKGFTDWLQSANPDVICIQETKAQEHQLVDPCFTPKGYHCFYEDAVKKGYSGTAIYSKIEPKKVIRSFGMQEIDDEGRYLEVQLGGINVVSTYLPSGSSGDVRQEAKYRFLDGFMEHLQKVRRRRSQTILCGDWNIAHKEIDLKNWKGNLKNSGFLPEERAWLDMLFDDIGMVDSFRVVNQEPDQYTWWSNRGQAWVKNVGWRIDYHIATPGLKHCATSESIYKDERFSDHAPLTIEYNCSL